MNFSTSSSLALDEGPECTSASAAHCTRRSRLEPGGITTCFPLPKTRLLRYGTPSAATSAILHGASTLSLPSPLSSPFACRKCSLRYPSMTVFTILHLCSPPGSMTTVEPSCPLTTGNFPVTLLGLLRPSGILSPMRSASTGSDDLALEGYRTSTWDTTMTRSSISCRCPLGSVASASEPPGPWPGSVSPLRPLPPSASLSRTTTALSIA
mmetsp:Transcript_22014/g.52008  ORF Transcript_22014/g.52008 Transcript_22014/m.52008 type:complete len:210 (+) Transcript_22014:277-906(+)